jgi:putative FmdB family regulatory protein
MPTYEYQCTECGHQYEAFQSMVEDPHKECPVCKGNVKRLISSGAGLIFKGSGFYITDYKKKESSPSEKNSVDKKESSDKKAPEKKSEKTDSSKSKSETKNKDGKK